MQTKQETGLLVRLWADEAAAFFFVGLLWLLALAGVSGYRPAAAAACGLLLLTHLRPWLAIAATAIVRNFDRSQALVTFSHIKALLMPASVNARRNNNVAHQMWP